MTSKSTFELTSQYTDMVNRVYLKWSLAVQIVTAVVICTMVDNEDTFNYDTLDYDNVNYTNENSTNATDYYDVDNEYHSAINDTLTLVANFCPALQMGESDFNVSITDTDHQSCCRPCSIEPDCHLMHGYNFCCPQATMAHYWSGSMYEAMCGHAVVNLKGSYLDLGYWSIQSCNDSSWTIWNHRDDFDDLVMVYSDGVLYINKHVAECNGVTEYKRWRLIVTACNYEAVKKKKHKSSLLYDVMRDCIVYSAPPPDFDVSHFVCHGPSTMINYCNITGLWETYDSSILFLCESGLDALVYDTDGTPYRNVYCLACNKPSSYMSTPKTCTRSFSHELPVIDELTILVAEESGEDFLEHGTLCDTSFFRDIYQKRCMPLLCPPGKAAYKRQCLLLAKDNHQLLQVMFRISPLDLLQTVDPRMITEENHKENNQRILSHIGILDECEVQGNDLSIYLTILDFRTSFAEFITYDLRLYNSDKCTERISSFGRNLQNRIIENFPFKAGLVSIDVNIEMTIPFVYDKTIYKKEHIASYDEVCINCSSKLIIPLNCPYIKLQPGDVCYTHRLQNPDSTTQCSTFVTSDIFKSSVVVGDELINDRWQSVFYICTHDYNMIFVSPRVAERPMMSSCGRLVKSFRFMFLMFLVSLLRRNVIK